MVVFCANCQRIPGNFFRLYSEGEIRSRADKNISDSLNVPYIFELHPSRASLTAAAQACPLCRLILNAEALEESDYDDAAICPSCLKEDGPVRLECGSAFDPEAIRVYNGSYWTTTLLFTVVPESWQPSNKAASDVEIVKSWMDTCQTSHPICRQSDLHFIPSRLIDLGPPGEDNHAVPRIQFESNLRGSPDGVQYAALSYCWGRSMPIDTKTTTQNLSSRALSGIPEASLPRTIRDAVTFTRRLGLRYLWVDALCILQDSERDWKSQSAKMSQIFSAAHITLAASMAPDTAAGFPRYEPFPNAIPSGPLRHAFLPFPAEEPDGTPKRVCLSLRQRDEVLGITLDPLQRRGWALQERHLSRRVAHLSWPYPIWECRTARSSGRLPWLPWSATTQREGRLLDGGSGPALAKRLKEYLAKGVWANLVLEYTRRSLTFDRDMFYAIAGLAAAVDTALECEDQYLAGLWRSTLPLSLCWKTGGVWADGNSRERLAAARLRAPSWSWASVTGPVYVGAESENATIVAASVLGAKCAASHDHQLGLKYDGWIRLKAPLKKVFVCASPPDQASFDADTDLCYNAVLFGQPGNEKRVGCMELDVYPEAEIRDQEVFCLAICSEPRLLSMVDDSSFPSGFIADNWQLNEKRSIVAVSLVLASTGTDGQYRRIGISEYMPESAYDGCEECVVTII